MAPYLYTGLIYLLAGFTQGFTGFGSALIAIPLLTFFLDLKVAVPLSVLAGLVITLLLSLSLRRKLERGKLGPLIIGALPGVVLGVVLVQQLPSELLRLILGGMLVLYALFGLLVRFPQRRLSMGWAWLAGFGGGLLGTVLGTIGPPAIVYTSLTNWTKDEIKATLSGFFLAGTIVVASAHALSGMISWTVLGLFGAAGPASVLGVVLGLWASRHTAEKDYRRVVLFLLLAMGCGMLFV